MYHVPFNRYNILKPHYDFWDTLYIQNEAASYHSTIVSVWIAQP
jgi:hypothetical protein